MLRDDQDTKAHYGQREIVRNVTGVTKPNFNEEFDIGREGRCSKQQLRTLRNEHTINNRSLILYDSGLRAEAHAAHRFPIPVFVLSILRLLALPYNRASTTCLLLWREGVVSVSGVRVCNPVALEGHGQCVGGAVRTTTVTTTPSLYTRVLVIEFVMTL